MNMKRNLDTMGGLTTVYVHLRITDDFGGGLIGPYEESSIAQHSKLIRDALENQQFERFDHPLRRQQRNRKGEPEPRLEDLPKEITIDNLDYKALELVLNQISECDRDVFEIQMEDHFLDIKHILRVLEVLEIPLNLEHLAKQIEKSIKRAEEYIRNFNTRSQWQTPTLVRNIYKSFETSSEIWLLMVEQVAQDCVNGTLSERDVVAVLMTTREFPDLDNALARRMMEVARSTLDPDARRDAAWLVRENWERREDQVEVDCEHIRQLNREAEEKGWYAGSIMKITPEMLQRKQFPWVISDNW